MLSEDIEGGDTGKGGGGKGKSKAKGGKAAKGKTAKKKPAKKGKPKTAGARKNVVKKKNAKKPAPKAVKKVVKKKVSAAKSAKSLAGEINKAAKRMHDIYERAVGHGETHDSLARHVQALGSLKGKVLHAAAEKFGVVPRGSKGKTLAAVGEKISRRLTTHVRNQF
jgi:hypothetical protein